MKFRILGLLSCGLLTLVTGTAQADFVTNGGFESPQITAPFVTYPVGSTAITGWTVISGANDPGAGSVDLLHGYLPAHSGAQAVDLDGSAAGGLSQSITGLTVGTTYVLDFFYTNNPFAQTTGSALVAYNGTTQTITHTGGGAYVEATYSFVATTTSFLLTFTSLDPAASMNGIILDDVSINTAAVPEPASIALVGLGLLSVGAFHRSRRRTA